MRRHAFGELVRTHSRLCRELAEQREALTNTLRNMYGQTVSDKDLEAHQLAVTALEEVKKRLSAVSLKMAAGSR